MRRRGMPIYQAETGVIAVMVVATIALIASTVKVADPAAYLRLPLATKGTVVQVAPQYAFTYVVVVYTALAMILISSSVLGLDLGGLRSRAATRLTSIALLVWSWLLVASVAAPSVLPCPRGIASDPWVYDPIPVLKVGLIGHDAVGSPPDGGYQQASGVYVNLCSLGTQQAAHWAVGLLGLAVLMTVVPALAAFVLVRLAKTPRLTSSVADETSASTDGIGVR